MSNSNQIPIPSFLRMSFACRLSSELCEVGGYLTFAHSAGRRTRDIVTDPAYDGRVDRLVWLVGEARKAGFSMPTDEAIRSALKIDWSKPPCDQVEIVSVLTLVLAGLSTAQALITVRAENVMIAILALRTVFQLGLGAAKAIVDEGRTPAMPLAEARAACDELNRIYLERAKFGTPFSVVPE